MFFQDLKTLLPRKLMNAHLTVTGPSQLLSPCNLWKQFCQGKNLFLAWLATEKPSLRIVGGESNKLSLQVHVCPMHNFLSLRTVMITLIDMHRCGKCGRTAAGTAAGVLWNRSHSTLLVFVLQLVSRI